MDLQAQSPRTGGSSSLSVPCWTHLPSRNRDLYTHSLKLLDVESQSCFSLYSGGWPVQSSKLCPWKAPPCLLFGPWPSVAPGGRRCRTIPRLFCECSSPSGQGLTLRLSLSHSRIWGASLEGKGHGLNAPSVDGVGKGPCFRGFPGPSARPSHRRSSLFPDGSLPS